tara:strand:+ start:1719 stop:2438 length:720 start_codon:yes stop_codon:yes gene_type:complete
MKNIKDNEILGLICARGGSKGLKNKNIKIFNSKPLIYWTIKIANKLKIIKKLYVSTDSKKIAKLSKKFGAEVPFLRPNKLATDKSPEVYTWRHALKFFYKKYKYLPGILLVLPVTSPLRKKEDVIKCINLYKKTKSDAVIAVTESYRNPYFNMIFRDKKGISKLIINSKKKITRRQDAPITFDMTTVAFVINTKFILKKKNIFKGIVRSVIVNQESSIDIDNIKDFKIAEFLKKNIKIV